MIPLGNTRVCSFSFATVLQERHTMASLEERDMAWFITSTGFEILPVHFSKFGGNKIPLRTIPGIKLIERLLPYFF